MREQTEYETFSDGLHVVYVPQGTGFRLLCFQLTTKEIWHCREEVLLSNGERDWCDWTFKR